MTKNIPGKKKLLIPFLISLIAFGLFANKIWSANFRTYETPEEAVHGYEANANEIEFLSVIEQNGLGLVFYTKNGAAETIKIENMDNRWRIVTNEALTKDPLYKKAKDYWILTGKVKDNYYIWITANDNFANISDPKDSLSSEFMHHALEREGYTTHNWFLVLNEIPSNYTVTLDGESVQVTD